MIIKISMAAKEMNPETIAFAKTLSNIPWCDDYEKMISGMLSVSITLPDPFFLI